MNMCNPENCKYTFQDSEITCTVCDKKWERIIERLEDGTRMTSYKEVK